MIFMGAMALTRMAQLNAATNTIVSDSVEGLKGLCALTSHVADFRRAELRGLLTDDSAARLAIGQKIVETQGEVATDLADYEKAALVEEDKRNSAEMKTRWAACVEGHTKLVG